MQGIYISHPVMQQRRYEQTEFEGHTPTSLGIFQVSSCRIWHDQLIRSRGAGEVSAAARNAVVILESLMGKLAPG
jgi:hypothetical protein